MENTEQYWMGQLQDKLFIEQGGCWYFAADGCHGLTQQNIEEIEFLVWTAQATDNAHQTAFPDFICENGFIEHFAVTSSNSSRKGYQITKTRNELQNKQKIKLDKELSGQNGSIRIAKDFSSIERKNDSLQNLHKSFFETWDRHIKSLNAYSGKKHISCFFVTSDDTILVHYQKKDSTNSKDEIPTENFVFGDMYAHENRMRYVPGYDKELLEFLLQYSEVVDYCIFIGGIGGIEILKLSTIPLLLQRNKNYKIAIDSTYAIESSNLIGVRIYDEDKGGQTDGT